MQATEMLKQAGYNDVTTVEPLQEQTAFKVGDVVTIKSGGPHMTVTHVGPHYIQVIYFTERTGITDGTFPPDALMATTSNE